MSLFTEVPSKKQQWQSYGWPPLGSEGRAKRGGFCFHSEVLYELEWHDVVAISLVVHIGHIFLFLFIPFSTYAFTEHHCMRVLFYLKVLSKLSSKPGCVQFPVYLREVPFIAGSRHISQGISLYFSLLPCQHNLIYLNQALQASEAPKQACKFQ